MDLKSTWKQHYSVAPAQLQKMRQVQGVASVFNTNIDAILKVKPAMVQKWLKDLGLEGSRVTARGAKEINEPADVLRGFIECFSKGVAQEWIVNDPDTYSWMRKHLGRDRDQMGGQGGIIANVMAVTGVQKVYVHCAALPADQAALFLDRENLLSTSQDGSLVRARAADRSGDIPVIHWILEFDKGDELVLDGHTVTCPKSNRFIAAYSPLSFVSSVEEGFNRSMRDKAQPLEIILISGYQMLTEPLPGGRSGIQFMEESWKDVEAWKSAHPGCIAHLEFASTEDISIRKALADKLVSRADSVGCNEQEEIQMLEAIGADALAHECARKMDSVSLFKGLLKIFETLKPPRVQLHMFGLYVTIAGERWSQKGETIRDGMVLAATIAAAKAGTGSIEEEKNLLWAHGREVSDHSLKELKALADHLKESHGIEGFESTGIGSAPGFRVVAVPTILVEKPVTLVGMGDTISSLSLVGAR